MTRPAPLTPDEPERLDALDGTHLVDSPIEERFERITRVGKQLLGADICAISLIDSDRQFFKSVQGLDACETPRDASFCAHALLVDGPLMVEDARRHPVFADSPLVTGEPYIAAYIGVPVRDPDGHRIGVLCADFLSPRTFSPGDVGVIQDLAAWAELEIRSAPDHAGRGIAAACSAQQRADLLDPLTRVWNDAGIRAIVAEALARACVNERPIALLSVDIEGFTRINERFGHTGGDQVLRQATRCILTALRAIDSIGRMQGDRFLCVLEACGSRESALQIASRVAHELERTAAPVDHGTIPIRASIAVHMIDGPRGVSPGKAIEAVLAALEVCRKNSPGQIFVSDAPRHAA